MVDRGLGRASFINWNGRLQYVHKCNGYPAWRMLTNYKLQFMRGETLVPGIIIA